VSKVNGGATPLPELLSVNLFSNYPRMKESPKCTGCSDVASFSSCHRRPHPGMADAKLS